MITGEIIAEFFHYLLRGSVLGFGVVLAIVGLGHLFS